MCRRPASPCRRCPRLARRRSRARTASPFDRLQERSVGWRKLVVVVLVPAVLGAAGIVLRADCAIHVATGIVSHNVCSKTFVSGLEPQTVFSETTERDGLRRLRRLLRFQVDRTTRTVDASAAGMLDSRAVFHEGLGCVLLHGSREPYILRSDIEALKVPKSPPLLGEIAGPDVVQPSDPALKAALDHAFDEPADP